MAGYPQYNPYTSNFGAYGQIGQNQPGYYQAPQMSGAAAQTAPSVRAVYSEAEARAAQIPTDGNPVIFIDQSGEVIYTKRFSFETGAFPFEIYRRVPAEQAAQPRYATLEDLEKLRAELTKEAKANAE